MEPTCIQLADRYDPGMANELGRLVRELREARNLTQASLGEGAGISGAQVSRIESGDGTTPGTLDSLAEALGVDPQMLHMAYAIDKGYRLADFPTDDATYKAIFADLADLTPEGRDMFAAYLHEMVKVQDRKSVV